VKTTVETFGRVDILVNVAGVTGPLESLLSQTTVAAFRDTMDANVLGCFLMIKAVIPHMMAQYNGKIVNVGGTFGIRGVAGRSAYSASKWALRGITKSAALELGPYGINVNNVCPGMVDGERFQRVLHARAIAEDVDSSAIRRRIEASYALRRVSTPEDIANSVVFLSSDRSRQITGHDLIVDGGSFI
jgi:3-oxoacyl-[acyl-carrier protein] reductase